MKRKANVKSYTRVVNGKTVHVKTHSRTVGREGTSKAGAGNEFKSKKAAATAPASNDEFLSRMFRLGPNGEVQELPYDRSEIKYVGDDAAEVGTNPMVKPGEKISASRKQWLADLDRKLTPEERRSSRSRSEEAPMTKAEFARSLDVAKRMKSLPKATPVTEVAPSPKVSRLARAVSVLGKVDSALDRFIANNTKKKWR